jgi:rRNA-processing protein FCF1
MKVLMDADCLIKLTKSKLKELVCKNFSVSIPQIVKEEVIDNARRLPDAIVIEENLVKNLLKIHQQSSFYKKGEEAVFTIFREGKYDAVCSDDKRFIKRLRTFDIPYITPSVFIAILLKSGKLTISEANEKLKSLSPFVSEDEYNAVKLIIKNWRV